MSIIAWPELTPGVSYWNADGTPKPVFIELWNTTLRDLIDALQRASSYPVGISTAQAQADGATAKIVIPDHTRAFLDIDVPIVGTEITGLAYATTYYAYQDDLGRAGTGEIQVTTDPAVAVASATSPYRQFMGTFVTPASGVAPPVVIDRPRPPTTPDGYAIP